MDQLFDIHCRNCGAPVAYDIVSQSYRCPHCGEVNGIQEVRQRLGFRTLDPGDRKAIRSSRQVCSCPNCGAEVLYDFGEESEVCSFCGSALVRREFEESDQFPEFMIPFVLNAQEAADRLRGWAEENGQERILAHVQELQGWYLPYILVRGPVSGYVRREQVKKEFSVRGYVSQALVSTSRQVDNETLDAAEPFDLNALRPFEHGFLAGHRVKLPDLTGAGRERRTLKEAAGVMRDQLKGTFHTEGVRVNLTDSALLELPVLLPVYLLKLGRTLAVVNGQTGRVAMKTEETVERSKLWMAEPIALGVLVLAILRLITGSLITALAASIPLIIAIAGEYRGGRFSLFQNRIYRGRESKASRQEGELQVREGSLISPVPPIKPIFRETVNGEVRDVSLKFYPARRVIALVIKVFTLYFLPYILGGVLRLIFGVGTAFRPMGSIPWFWIFGIFLMVYLFTGVRCEAYERPYIYALDRGKPGRLLGKAKDRSLPFFYCVGLDWSQREELQEAGFPVKKLKAMYLIFGAMLGVSILSTIL